MEDNNEATDQRRRPPAKEAEHGNPVTGQPHWLVRHAIEVVVGALILAFLAWVGTYHEAIAHKIDCKLKEFWAPNDLNGC